MRHGTFQIAIALESDAQLQMRRRERRREADRLSQMLESVLESTELSERHTEVVAGLGMLRTQTHSRAQWCERTVEVFGPPPGRAEMVVRVEQCRFELDCTLERIECFRYS